MRIGTCGVEMGETEFILLHRSGQLGDWFIVKGKRQEVQIRVTKSGLVRVGKPYKTSPHMTCFEQKEERGQPQP